MGEVKIPGPQYGLNEIIDAYTDVSEDPKRFNPLRPSSAGRCERRLGYEMMEYRGLASYEKEQMKPETKRLLDLGHQIEKHAIYHARQAFERMEKPAQIKYQQQVLRFFKLPDGTHLEGSIDKAVLIDGHLIVCDWKSKADKFSQIHKTSWDEFNEKLEKTGYAVGFGNDAVFITDLKKFLEVFREDFFTDNLYQANFYACSDFLRDGGCSIASVLQYNKNDSRVREVRFVPDQDVFEECKEKFCRTQANVDDKRSPEALKRDYTLGSVKCAFCPFRRECWPEEDALKAFFRELPAKQWPTDLERLPKNVQEQVIPLFKHFTNLPDAAKELERVEREIAGILYNAKVFKVRLSPELIYVVKKLKTGLVIRRSKV